MRQHWNVVSMLDFVHEHDCIHAVPAASEVWNGMCVEHCFMSRSYV